MRPFVTAAVTAAVALSLVGCDGSKGNTAASPSTAPASTPAPTPTASSSTPAAVPTTPAAPQPRTKAELTKALLALPDLPPGLAIDPDSSDDGSRLSSSDAHCASLVKIFNSQTAPGAKASVVRLFSGGQQGPFIEEDLDALASAADVTKLLATTRAAIKSCHKVKLTIPGEGSSTMQVSEVSAPKAGTTPVAVRFAASGGPLDGLEVTFALAGLGDVVLAINVDDPAQLEGATTAAVEKATKVLGAPKAGA